jgi:hypothetical protein
LWIITDRVNKSGDNGEAFFRYLNDVKFKDADFVYAISNKESLKNISRCGRVINYDSLKYKVMHLAADCLISAHADLPIYNPFGNYAHPYKDILSRKKKIFLQHGIIESDLSGWLNKYNKNLTGFTNCLALIDLCHVFTENGARFVAQAPSPLPAHRMFGRR